METSRRLRTLGAPNCANSGTRTPRQPRTAFTGSSTQPLSQLSRGAQRKSSLQGSQIAEAPCGVSAAGHKPHSVNMGRFAARTKRRVAIRDIAPERPQRIVKKRGEGQKREAERDAERWEREKEKERQRGRGEKEEKRARVAPSLMQIRSLCADFGRSDAALSGLRPLHGDIPPSTSDGNGPHLSPLNRSARNVRPHDHG